MKLLKTLSGGKLAVAQHDRPTLTTRRDRACQQWFRTGFTRSQQRHFYG
jgi:hypothetical protein